MEAVDRWCEMRPYKNTEVIKRKWLIKLLYKPIDQVKNINEEQLEQVVKEHPIIRQLYDLMGAFKEILLSKKPEDINNWITEASVLDREEINRFIGGITRDMKAVNTKDPKADEYLKKKPLQWDSFRTKSIK